MRSICKEIENFVERRLDSFISGFMVLYKHISTKRRILSTDPLPLTCLTCRSDFFLSFGKPEGFSFSGTKDHVLPGHVKVPWLLSLANKLTAVLGLLCLQSIDGCYICFSSLSNEYKAFYHNNMTGYASVSSRASQASLVRYVKLSPSPFPAVGGERNAKSITLFWDVLNGLFLHITL